MPLGVSYDWILLHEWDIDKYKDWKEEDLIEELKSLKKFCKEHLKVKLSLKEVIKRLKKTPSFLIKKNKKMLREEYNFTVIVKLLSDWKFFRVTCKSWGRIWIAQDESHLGCFRTDKQCNYLPNQSCCNLYKPLTKLRPIKEIIEEIDGWRIA